jgi:Rad52/22 family double-strand break repair protein
MTGFTEEQVRELRRKLDRRCVQTREADGRNLDYIEGWFAVAEANAIFGFDGWDRVTTHFERVFERNRPDTTTCAYMARIRIRVRANGRTIVREGSGWGESTAKAPTEAHERALKSAETDATKRALATFGNRFGLGLYDKEQNGVTRPKASSVRGFAACDPRGDIIAEDLSPEGFCGAMRQLLQQADGPAEVEQLWVQNEPEVARLRSECPKLKTERGEHYGDILARLASDRIGPFYRTSGVKLGLPAPLRLKPSRIAPEGRIDKSRLAIGTEPRARDKDHLKLVAERPCLICARMPSHAHHLTFAQRRGLSIKVSDEFTVPLCAIHHDECHRSGNERSWWARYGVDPTQVAAKLWRESQGTGQSPAEAAEVAAVPSGQTVETGLILSLPDAAEPGNSGEAQTELPAAE